MASPSVSLKNFEIQKPEIDYARFGRKAKFHKVLFVLQFVLLAGFYETFYLLFFANHYFKSVASLGEKFFKEGYFYTYTLLHWKLIYWVMEGRLPTHQEVLIYLGLSLLLCLFFFSRFNPLPKPVNAWLFVVSFVYLVSSLFFYFFWEYFPYTTRDFGMLYVILEFGVLFMVPLAMSLALSIFAFHPLNLLTNFLIVGLTLFYAALWGAIRYYFSLLVLKYFSYLHMATLFFIFGPLLDFIYVSAFYSLAVYLISCQSRRGARPFRWIF